MTFKELLNELNTSNIKVDLSFLNSKIGKELSVKTIQKELRKQNEIEEVDYELVKTNNTDLKGSLSIAGEYAADIDEENEGDNSEPVLIVRIVHFDDKLIITKDIIDHISKEIFRTINHEMIHMQQARKRWWEAQRSYYKDKTKLKNDKIYKDKSYLSNDDEIEAYAHDIAQDFLEQMDKNTARQKLSSKDAGKYSDRLAEYIELFGQSHIVIKKLFKKISMYLDVI